MKILVTSPGTLFKANGGYYTKIIYGYNYFSKYFNSFDEVVKVGQCLDNKSLNINEYLRVDGPKVKVQELPKSFGFFNYFRKKRQIEKCALNALLNCDAAALRIPDPLSFFLIKQCVRHHIPFVVEITTDVWTYLSPKNNTLWYAPVLKYYWHYLQKDACQKAIGVSYVTRNHLQSRYPSYKRIHPEDNLHFESAFTDADISVNDFAKTSKSFLEHKGDYKLVHVSGSLSNDGKGYKELLMALNELKDNPVKLILVGDGDFSEPNKEYVKQHVLENKIVKIGRINDRTELFKILRDSDIFVFPSYTEGLPRVVVEAMANALPCIGSDIPGNIELMQPEAIVPVKSSKALADKIFYFISHPELLDKQSELNLEKAKQFYSKEATEQLANTFYGCLLESVKKS